MKFHDAIAITQTSTHTYTATFQPDWTVGTVPHGGYVTSCFLAVVQQHFHTTLRAQNQPNTLACHLDFLRRTQCGPATFTVQDVKLGRQTSVVHVTLTQDGDREEVVGYFTNADLRGEKGVTYDTHWQTHPQPVPVDLAKLDANEDPLWGEARVMPFSEFRKVTQRVRTWFPRQGQADFGIVDQWMALKEGGMFTNECLGLVVDLFPQILGNFANGTDMYAVEPKEDLSNKKAVARMWYPTLLLNLDVKKALPEEGVKYLYVRIEAKQIKNGRYDLELIVKDAEGDLVALSHHVVLSVDASRNTSARRKVEKPDSKL